MTLLAEFKLFTFQKLTHELGRISKSGSHSVFHAVKFKDFDVWILCHRLSQKKKNVGQFISGSLHFSVKFMHHFIRIVPFCFFLSWKYKMKWSSVVLTKSLPRDKSESDLTFFPFKSESGNLIINRGLVPADHISLKVSLFLLSSNIHPDLPNPPLPSFSLAVPVFLVLFLPGWWLGLVCFPSQSRGADKERRKWGQSMQNDGWHPGRAYGMYL